MKQVLVLLVVGMLMGGLGTVSVPAEAHPVILLQGVDYASKAPATIKAGFVALEFVNAGAEPHHAQVLRLNDGVTPTQFQEALKKGEEAALPLVSLVGGPGMVAPGRRERVSVNLTPGTYVLACFVPSHDGTPHLAKGMLSFFRVTGPAARPGSLRSAGDIVLNDFSIALPQGFTGRGIYRVLNRGAQPREVIIVRLAPGKTVQDLQAFASQQGPLSGPPSFIPAGEARGSPEARLSTST
ncbi:MAG: hypothetical protein QN209_12780 [Armatimonadota bacterium]|nr:hypothetical protein [Armatimonadota bacterium]